MTLFSAEMFAFVSLVSEFSDDIGIVIKHILPLTNFSLSFLQRGYYNQTTQQFQPPPLELYTHFSTTTYFLAFWVILLLRCLSIFIADMVLVNSIPQHATLWDRILHAIQKSSFPFPYTNWHQGNGSCKDHMERKKASQNEVLVSIAINLFFNMVLLIPLPILCKIFKSSYSCYP